MKYNFLPVVAVLCLLGACSKSSYQTKPQIKVKSVNTTQLPQNGDALLVTTFTFTDKEGDIKDGIFTYLPVLLNTRPLATAGTEYEPIALTVDFEVPDNSKADFQLKLTRGNLYRDIVQGLPTNDRNDTIQLKAVFVDRGGHSSDTVTTEKIVLLGQ